jgi:ribosomal protein S18 acetylase RimI-like enzyme
VLILARLGGRVVGCGAVRFAGSTADIKRMWVHPEARGLGLGSRILRALEERAAEGGATSARLETNRSLVEAIAMYRSHGYREVAAFNDERYAQHWFEKALHPSTPLPPE